MLTRRHLLQNLGMGAGLCGLAGTVAGQAAAASPLSARNSHHPIRAKRLIFLFMAGGPSHVDLFDPKPRLEEFDGKPAPFKLPNLERTPPGKIRKSPFTFRRYGESGIDVSEMFPHVARHVDDLCVIRSMVADNINHNGACLQMNTGEQTFSRPSMGSWLLYGLGTENQNLPGFVVVAPNQPAQGAPLWDSSFLPAAYQGTCVTDLKQPITNLANNSLDANSQRRQLDLLARLNRIHRNQSVSVDELDARIASFELAFRMQSAAPEAFDLSGESKITQELYGIDDTVTQTFGEQCLLARRLVERGVRFVQIFCGAENTTARKIRPNWDSHEDLPRDHGYWGRVLDGGAAALLKDLKARGLLDETLVICTTEFGRQPAAQGNRALGRDHNADAFTAWFAGGGIKGGASVSALA